MKARSLAAALLGILMGVSGLYMPDSAQAQNQLQKIQKRGYVRVGAVQAPPYYKQDPQTNQWRGLVPDIMEAMFSTIDVKVRYVPTQWGTAVAGLQADKFDLIGGYNATPQRALSIDFTDPIGYLLVSVVTLGNDTEKWHSWDTIAKEAPTIAAVDGAGTTTAAQHILGDRVHWLLVKSNDQMLLDLETGRADLALSNQPTLVKYIQQRGKGHLIIPKPKVRQPTNIGLRKTQTKALRDWLNVAIAYLKSEKALATIWQKYMPTK
jgi:polar amino acid transport system substrate-binding protein